jgi:hypothetical protein
MIAIVTDAGVGGTFLSWTVYYLSGKTHYFSARDQTVVSLPDNPLTSKNAHAFVPNQPRTLTEFKKFLPLLVDTEECVYMHQFKSGTEEAVQQLCKQSTKVIILSIHPDQILYQCGYSPRAPIVANCMPQKILTDPDDIYNDFTNHFFKESKQQWEKENLTNVWDKREFIALNFSPFSYDSILNYISDNAKYYHINALDIWTNFDQWIQEMFVYLGMSINQTRYQIWLPIYNQWKNKHTKRLMFSQNFKTIINNILLGVELDLIPFDLDIQQEATIQHFLIYNHNLNFKTWQLIKFVNTKQLHNLLEPNVHNLN